MHVGLDTSFFNIWIVVFIGRNSGQRSVTLLLEFWTK